MFYKIAIIECLITVIRCTIVIYPNTFDSLGACSYNMSCLKTVVGFDDDVAKQALVKVQQYSNQQEFAGINASTHVKNILAEEAKLYAERAAGIIPVKDDIICHIEERIRRLNKFIDATLKYLDQRYSWYREAHHLNHIMADFKKIVLENLRYMQKIQCTLHKALQRIPYKKFHLTRLQKRICKIKQRLEAAIKSTEDYKIVASKVSIFAALLAVQVVEERNKMKRKKSCM